MTTPMMLAGPLILALCAIIAIGLVVIGLRGRRVHDRPVCARCKFDVTGLMARSREAADASIPRCPECGADLSGRAAVRRGLRQRRLLPLASGVVLLLLLASVVVVGLTSGLTHTAVAIRMPTTMLVTASSLDPHDAYLIELAARIDSAETGPEENALLATRVLRRLSDSTTGLSPAWNEVFAALYRASAIANADIEKALGSTLAAELRVRDTVRADGPLSVMTTITMPRWSSPVSLTVGARGATAEFRDAEGNTVARVSQSGYTLQHGHRHSNVCMSSGVRTPDILPGTYDVELIVPIVARAGASSGDEFPIEIPVRVRKQIVVIAQDEALVRVVHDAEHEARVRASIDSIKARAQRTTESAYLYATVTFKGLPVAVAYQVYATPAGASDDERVSMGSLVAPQIRQPDGRHSYGIGGAVPVDFAPGSIDLIFEPDAAAAERSIDVHEIAAAAMRIEGIAVEWDAP